MTIAIEKTSWQDAEQELREIRTRLFIDEQRVPETLEWDGEDAQSTHFLARSSDGTAVGCIRLMPSGQLSRLSVLEPYRNQGIGSALLATAEEEARVAGMTEVFLHAQTHATSFYESAGFVVNGGIFMEADIPHRQMYKEVAAETH